MVYEIDQIVKIVLYRLGQLKKVNMISNLNYSKSLSNQMAQVFFLSEVETVEACEIETDIWIPELTCKQLMAVYQGLPVDALSEVVIEALLKGYKIMILKESVELLRIQSRRTPFISRYFEALKVLEQSGLEIRECVNEAHSESALKKDRETLQNEEMNRQTICAKAVDLNQRVLTESQLIHFRQQNIEVVNIQKNTIITPSAQDYLRQNPITLNRK